MKIEAVILQFSCHWRLRLSEANARKSFRRAKNRAIREELISNSDAARKSGPFMVSPSVPDQYGLPDAH